jgi:hypothetical protein
MITRTTPKRGPREVVAERRYFAKNLMTITDNGFLYDVADGDSYTLNRTGMLIYRSLLAGEDSREVWRELVRLFQIEGDQARRDVTRFLEHLHRINLVDATE